MSSLDEVKLTVDTVDWTKKEQVLTLFPSYVREKFHAEDNRIKLVNTVHIEDFTLQTPFKDQTMLKDTELLLEPNKRHCLFGRNGTGKTLLFERMADYSIPGFPKHLNVHHLKELEHLEVAENVLDTVIHSHGFMMTLRQCKLKIDPLVEAAAGEVKEQLQATQFMIDRLLKNVMSEDAEDRVKKMLRALGFDEFGMKVSTNDLSGGLRMRVALACAFFSEADLLLLDEPTNHLDFPSVLWLENRLRGYRGSFLLVTHDRDLLVNVTTSTLLLEDKKIIYYPCGYGEFEKRKAKEDKKKDDEGEKFLNKHGRNADPSTQTGRMVHDMRVWRAAYQKKLVQMAGKFTFPKADELAPPAGVSLNEDGSVTLIKLEDVRFSYNAEKGLPFIFDTPISFEVTTKSRYGIMGPNGAGKSTLLKLLTKKIHPTEGKFSEHPSFVLAYFGQHSTAELEMEKTPLEFMVDQFPDSAIKNLRDHLAKTGVDGGVESTRMQNLSYSQRSCVIFSKLTYVCPHLLIMDEPTNFLDLESVDSLIAAANKFPGALLVVTHSRGFLRKCAKKYLSVVPGQFLAFDGMKEAEEATYTFIQELESGVKFDASALSAGGGSMSSNNANNAAARAAGPAAKKEAPAEPIVCPDAKFAVGEEVLSMWTDKKFYEGHIKAIVSASPIKYAVFYPAHNKTANIPEAGIKKAAGKDDAEERKNAAVAKKQQEEADAKKAASHKWADGDKCLCMRSDGRFYAATVVKVKGFDMFDIKFVDTFKDNQNMNVNVKKIRLFDTSKVSAAPAGGGGGGGKGGGKGNTNKGGKGNSGKGGQTAAAGGKGGGRGRAS